MLSIFRASKISPLFYMRELTNNSFLWSESIRPYLLYFGKQVVSKIVCRACSGFVCPDYSILNAKIDSYTTLNLPFIHQPRHAMHRYFIIINRPIRKISSPLQNKVDFQLPEQHQTGEYSLVFRNYNTLRNESLCKYKNNTYQFGIEFTIPCYWSKYNDTKANNVDKR